MDEAIQIDSDSTEISSSDESEMSLSDDDQSEDEDQQYQAKIGSRSTPLQIRSPPSNGRVTRNRANGGIKRKSPPSYKSPLKPRRKTQRTVALVPKNYVSKYTEEDFLESDFEVNGEDLESTDQDSGNEEQEGVVSDSEHEFSSKDVLKPKTQARVVKKKRFDKAVVESSQDSSSSDSDLERESGSESEAHGSSWKESRMIVLSLKCVVDGCEHNCKNKEELRKHLLAKHALARHRCLRRGCSKSFESK